MGEEESRLLSWPVPTPEEAMGLRGLPARISRGASEVRGGGQPGEKTKEAASPAAAKVWADIQELVPRR